MRRTEKPKVRSLSEPTLCEGMDMIELEVLPLGAPGAVLRYEATLPVIPGKDLPLYSSRNLPSLRSTDPIPFCRLLPVPEEIPEDLLQ